MKPFLDIYHRLCKGLTALGIHRVFGVLLVVLLSGCDKTPINGDLDGMWQLQSIETPEGTTQTKERRVYLCIQLHLAEWWNPAQMNEFHFFSHFTHQGDSLCFFDLCRASAHTATGSDDTPLTAKEMAEGALESWGIHTLDTRYRIRRLSSRHLELEKDDTVYAFRKF